MYEQYINILYILNILNVLLFDFKIYTSILFSTVTVKILSTYLLNILFVYLLCEQINNYNFIVSGHFRGLLSFDCM